MRHRNTFAKNRGLTRFAGKELKLLIEFTHYISNRPEDSFRQYNVIPTAYT